MGENYSVAIDLGGTIIKIGLILDSEIVRFTTILSLIHISEPTRQAEISYAVFCLKKKKKKKKEKT